MKIVDEVKVFMRDPSSFAPLLLCHDHRNRHRQRINNAGWYSLVIAMTADHKKMVRMN